MKFRFFSFVSVVFCLLCLSLPAFAGDAFDDVVEQGVVYFKRDLVKQAKAKFDEAYQLPEGKRDFRTLYYRAQCASKLLLLEQAFEMIEVARQVATPNSKESERLETFANELSSLYGGVTFKAAPGETNAQGRIFFEAKTGIINKEKKERFYSIRERFKSTDISLPTKVYLPYGEYLANKVPFSLIQGEPEPEIEIYLQMQIDSAKKSSGVSPWLVAGIGGAAAVAAGVAAYFIFSGDSDTTTTERLHANFE